MSLFQKFVALSMSFMLVFSFAGADLAFADNDNSTKATENDDPQMELDLSTSGSAVSSEQEESETDGNSITSNSAADAIEFVYLDNSVVSLGQEEHMVIGLLDNGASLSSASIVLSRSDGGDPVTVQASSFNGSASLFSFTFNDEQDAVAYTLRGFSYSLEGASSSSYVDFSMNDNDRSACVVDVVKPEIADAVAAAETDNQNGVLAFTLEDGGSLEAAGSIEEAIQKADAEGVANSAVDQLSSDQEKSSLEAESNTAEGVDDVTNSGMESAILTPFSTYSSVSSARENYLIVALDPGHGGSDSGATGNGLLEKDVNLSIAQHCYDELNTYSGVTPILTRNGDYYVGLQQRVDIAASYGADVFVSLHCNSGSSSASGAEVYYPNASSYNYNVYVEGKALAQKIYNKLSELGLDTGRGIKYRDSEYYDGEGPFYYPDGSIQDFYSVIESSREKGIPGLIVEHAFISNSTDAQRLSNDSFRQQLGEADATGIAQQYELLKKSNAQAQSLVQVKAHVANIGWESEVYDQKVAGTIGKNFGLEAFQVSLQNAAANLGGVTYQSYVGSRWQDWKSDGDTSGTTNQGTALQAIRMQLTGAAEQSYDIYYRVHVSNIGWLGWAKNGESAGSIGYDYAAEAVEIVVVAKNAAAPGDTTAPFKQLGTTVTYQAHVSDIGWQPSVLEDAVAGTTGRNLAVEAVKLSLAQQQESGSIEYNAHVSDIGWQGWKADGDMAGTTGRSLQMEAIQIRLSGEVADKYDIYYRVHSAEFGWLDWAKNGESAGTEGYAYAMQAFQIQLVPKGSDAPGDTTNPFRENSNSNTRIMGSSLVTVEQMVEAYSAQSPAAYPFSVYTQYGAADIARFCTILKEEAETEGVRADVVFAQAMLETGWLQFGGDVKAEQCNFAGLGATGGVPGNCFNDWGTNSVRKGLRAQIQHLKCYASTDDLINDCVDPRWSNSLRGKAPYIEWLSIPNNPYGVGWAADTRYADKLKSIMKVISAK